MAGEMKAGDDTLGKAANMVSAAHGDFNKLASTLHTQIQGAASKFQGQAGSAFQSLGTEWNERQTKIVNALNDFETALQSTQKTNQSTDTEHRQAVSTLTGRLGSVPGKY